MTFTVNYQIRLLALLCLDKNLYLQTSSTLTKNDFNTFVGQWIFELTHVYYYRDLGNYIDKILYTYKQKPKEMKKIKPFVEKPKGQRD